MSVLLLVPQIAGVVKLAHPSLLIELFFQLSFLCGAGP